MGEELSLARAEEKGQSMLLAITGSGESITTSSHRNKRTQKPSPSKVSYGRKAKDTKTKGKSSRKAKGLDGSSFGQKARRGRGYQDRESDRGDEGAHKPVGRSAQELGIVYPDSYCDDARIVPHYWTGVDADCDGSLFQCKLCRRHIWLPSTYLEATRLGNLMRWYGVGEGYCRYLNRHRPAKLLMAKLQDLRRLEMEMTDKREFAKLTDKILSDRDYDRKEVE